MAGHSKWATTKHKKAAKDKKRSKLFTRLVKEIMVAAKNGLPDPIHNAALRQAVVNARVNSLPKDAIDKALNKASGADAESYDAITYEGFGQGGVAFVVECLTDNRNRSASDVRSTFTKLGGNLGATGSVSHNFEYIGFISYPFAVASVDKMFEIALDAGANDVEDDGENHIITTSKNDFVGVREKLYKTFGDAVEANLIWSPVNYVAASGEVLESINNLIDKLEDLDDVQYVYTNLLDGE
jgi:YebC/PmpR family DNA-binding regulatory protein